MIQPLDVLFGVSRVPGMYDGSMSYLEFLGQVSAKLNEIITSTNGIDTKFTNLKSYVDNFFQDINITEQVMEAVQTLYDNGTLADLIVDISTNVENVVNGKLEPYDNRLIALEAIRISSVPRLALEVDDTGRFQRAVNASFDKTIVLDIATTISATINITKPMRILGLYAQSMIHIPATFPMNSELFAISPIIAGQEGVTFENVCIMAVGGTPARDIIRFTCAAGTSFNSLTVKNCYIQALSGGHAISFTGAGIQFARIENNVIYGGILLDDAGDSCYIRDNNIKGKNIGIEVHANGSVETGYPACLEITGNNIVSDGGAIKLTNVRDWWIEKNNIEQIAPISLGYAVEINGVLYNHQRNVFAKNKVECAGPVSKANCLLLKDTKNVTVVDNEMRSSSDINQIPTRVIRIENTPNVFIDRNDLYVADGGTGVEITGNLSTGVVVGDLNRYTIENTSNSAAIGDQGIGTAGVWKYPTSVLFDDFSINYAPLSYKKNGKIVTVNGTIKLKTGDDVSPSTVIFTLADGFRPAKAIQFLGQYDDTNGTLQHVNIRVKNDGVVDIMSTVTNMQFINLGNIQFEAV